METNSFSTNKIVSILIAIVVTACVLIPICNEFGNSGDSGTNTRSSVPLDKMAKFGYDFEDYWFTDVDNKVMRDYVEQDGDVYNIRFIPGYDGLTYKEGELVMLSLDSLRYDISGPVCEVYYRNNMFYINSFDRYNWDTIEVDCIGFVLGLEYTGEYYPIVYVVPLDSAEDTTIYDSYSEDIVWKGNSDYDYDYDEMFNMIAYAKLHGADYDKDMIYITDNPDVYLKYNDVKTYMDSNYELVFSDTEWESIHYYQSPNMSNIGYWGNVPIVEFRDEFAPFFMPSTITIDKNSDYEFPIAFLGTYLDYDEITNDEIKELGKKDISLDKWKGWIFNMEADVIFDEPQYLIFDTDIPYYVVGESDGGNSGIAGTLITIIPVFVLLAILGSVAYMFVGRAKE